MRRFFGLSLFAAAFGVVEGAVVVYLRALAYPDGFAFPLQPVPLRIGLVELVREAATIAMLLGAAWAAECRPIRRFAAFAWCFGVWDVVYYLALKAFLGWPAGLLTWDVLFLIPAPWLGPVLAPVLVSFALMAAAFLILRRGEAADFAFLRPVDWWIESACGLVVITSFLVNGTGAQAPERYPWWLFGLGWGGGLAWFAHRWRRRPRTPLS